MSYFGGRGGGLWAKEAVLWGLVGARMVVVLVDVVVLI